MNSAETNQLNELINQGWSEVDAKEILAERIECSIRSSLKSRIERLDALDTTESGHMKDSAHCNAMDTCSDNGLSRDCDSIAYLEAYVATLSAILDSAGISY